VRGHTSINPRHYTNCNPEREAWQQLRADARHYRCRVRALQSVLSILYRLGRGTLIDRALAVCWELALPTPSRRALGDAPGDERLTCGPREHVRG
jgi:hypothetical protein